MTQLVSPSKQGLYDPRYEHDACGLGFVVHVKGQKSHDIVRQGIQVLLSLEHRGASGSEKDTGDGAGILLQVPHLFLARESEELRIALPSSGFYGVGMVFLPKDPEGRQQCEELFEKIVREEGQTVLGWRTVPVNDTTLGLTAKTSAPVIRQIFIGRNTKLTDELAFERKLYVIRKRVSKGAKRGIHERRMFYVSSLSSRTIVYKGMLTAGQLASFYPDLSDSSVESSLALVHSRFSTNTFPSWARAHPYRYIAHNGEINTLRGNINWMHARESKFKSRLFGADLSKVLPVIDTAGSDSGMFDNTLEMLVLAGRSLPHAMMIPGRMLLVDTQEGRIIDDKELKQQIATEHPYGQWLHDNLISLESIPASNHAPEPDHHNVVLSQQNFGYTKEELSFLLNPMGKDGNEAIGSMGTDTPLAVLSDRPQLLYNYFKQLFAQVTNPPVDAIREELIMSTDTTVGPEANMLEPSPDCARQIRLSSPILANEELEKLKHLSDAGLSGFKSTTLPMLFDASMGGRGLEQALDELCRQANTAIAEGYGIIILSDRGVNRERAPIPALLAVSGVHHHLIRQGTRTQVGLVIESGEPREVHHFALLLGYGAAAINPYLAFETLRDMTANGALAGVSSEKAIQNYIKAVAKGIVKIISKMGISTIQSYCGAQIFEAVGLDQDFVDRYFTWTPSRIGGVGLNVIAEEVLLRHRRGFPGRGQNDPLLDEGGQYSYRQKGEYHLFNPETIHKLQYACRTNSYKVFKEYSRLVDDQSRRLCTLRGLMKFSPAQTPIPIEEVESVEEIVKRFKTGAMSYGSISREAHEALAIAMNRIGGKSNTGEGGEDPARYVTDDNGDSRNSAIKQVASGRFGVTSHYLVSALELQIKIAQGAKPGEGGQLPGSKVYPEIARVRHSTPGVGLISPPPHHDIYSIEDLAELIYDLKCANSRARISVKLVAEVGVGTVAAGVAKAHADVVLISGYDGGTGASPLTSIKHAGVPWELGLAEAHQTLVLNDLRSRITIETDGQLKTGRDVVTAALLGAEEFGFASAPLVSLGCIMMRACHLNTCPVGVATQDPKLRARFAGSPDHVVNFMCFVAQEVRELMAQLGFRTLKEMVGHTECIEMRTAVEHWKAHGLDFSAMLYQPDVPQTVGRHCQVAQDHGLERSLDHTTLRKLCEPALKNGQPVSATLPVRNVNRAVGTMLGSEVTRRYGANGLPDDTISLRFKGSAGQSFGAFIPRGITLTLEGDANDYVGKGLSGGKIVVCPPKDATFAPEENVCGRSRL